MRLEVLNLFGLFTQTSTVLTNLYFLYRKFCSLGKVSLLLTTALCVIRLFVLTYYLCAIEFDSLIKRSSSVKIFIILVLLLGLIDLGQAIAIASGIYFLVCGVEFQVIEIRLCCLHGA